MQQILKQQIVHRPLLQNPTVKGSHGDVFNHPGH